MARVAAGWMGGRRRSRIPLRYFVLLIINKSGLDAVPSLKKLQHPLHWCV
jgi:hypothetical protein